jgi:hypothetical protein
MKLEVGQRWRNEPTSRYVYFIAELLEVSDDQSYVIRWKNVQEAGYASGWIIGKEQTFRLNTSIMELLVGQNAPVQKENNI